MCTAQRVDIGTDVQREPERAFKIYGQKPTFEVTKYVLCRFLLFSERLHSLQLAASFSMSVRLHN